MMWLLVAVLGIGNDTDRSGVYGREVYGIGERWQIERVTGCYGDLEEVAEMSKRENLGISAVSDSSYTKGVFALTKPTCVLGDQPEDKATFDEYIQDYQWYVYALFDCNCGSCYLPDPVEEMDTVRKVMKARSISM